MSICIFFQTRIQYDVCNWVRLYPDGLLLQILLSKIFSSYSSFLFHTEKKNASAFRYVPAFLRFLFYCVTYISQLTLFNYFYRISILSVLNMFHFLFLFLPIFGEFQSQASDSVKRFQFLSCAFLASFST